MAIYRGPGGSGDAVNDSSSETRLAVEARDAAIAAQAAAEAAQVAAELAETNAETAETNAETAETNAETAATNAASSASAASTSASNASSSASSASTSATNAASSASSASSSASAASTSATNAATSATNAANSATAAATSATNASNSATAAASSASSASSSASTATTQASNASTSATNAASSATSAASSASTATTQAGLASTSATNAANSASAASTSATNASNSASAASTSASNAATSATNAASSATSAATSASSAQSASDAALAALDSFDDRYLGQKSSAPTVDNDGNALVTGALYFDTVSNAMKVWDGTQWLSAYASLSGALLATNNLSDLTSTSTARTNLGLGTAATTAATDYATAAQGAKADTALQPATIGVSVQGYDADTAKLDVSQSWSAAQSFNAGVTLGDASGDALTINSSAVSIPNGLNFGSNQFVITSAGNIGIGTASASTAAGFTMFRAGSTNVGLEVLSGSTSSVAFGYNNLGSANAWGAPTGVGYIGQAQNFPWVFTTNGTERMRITSGGNVGIGTTTPSPYKLYVNGNTYTTNQYIADTGQYNWGAGTTYLYGTSASNYMTFITNSAERMRIDSSGNLGLGVTPSAWSVGKAFEARNAGNAIFTNGAGEMILTANAYYNAGWKYGNTGVQAARYVCGNTNGTHIWETAPSGTAGNAITFTQAMTLDANGKLILGATSADGLFSMGSSSYGTSAIYQSIKNNGNVIIFGVESSTGGSLVGGSGTGYAAVLNSQNAYPLVFGTNNTERMRIDSSGNVGIGVTSPSYPLDVRSASNPIINLKATSDTGQAAIYIDGYASGGVYRASRIDFKQGGSITRTIISDYVQNGTADLSFCNAAGTRQMVLSVAGGLSIGTTADPGAGAIYATGNITANYSDERLKTKIGNIDNALDKVRQIETMVYHANDTAVALGYDASVIEVGVTAQSVQKVQPEIVVPAPVDQQYLTVRYDRLVPLLIEAIKELEAQIMELKK